MGDRVRHINPTVFWSSGVGTATLQTDPWQVVEGMVRVKRDDRDKETDGVVIPVRLLELDF
ncbi:MAG TPA: hypothetical protein V6D33_06410 [Cyanophyceae cyanobacterium]